MAYETLRLEIDGGIVRLTLNRPDKMNALSLQLLEELQAALREVIRTPEARVLILTGAGRGFSGGLDLAGLKRDPNDPDNIIRDYFLPAIYLLRDLRIPTISAVNGAAAGAGLALALACDLRVAARAAGFTCAFVNIALAPDSGASWFITQAIGEARAMRMMLLGEKIDAATAAEWGLVSHFVEDDKLAETADALAKKMAAGPTLAYAQTKRLVQKASTTAFRDQVILEWDAQVSLRFSYDHPEAVAAFREKRPPVFKGK
jgi:2-(1,2-epoxy-1,2-dihydrophenyl)acetyl-CoA isomerase